MYIQSYTQIYTKGARVRQIHRSLNFLQVCLLFHHVAPENSGESNMRSNGAQRRPWTIHFISWERWEQWGGSRWSWLYQDRTIRVLSFYMLFTRVYSFRRSEKKSMIWDSKLQRLFTMAAMASRFSLVISGLFFLSKWPKKWAYTPIHIH